ncbi:hypothetical protein EVAR_43316_1 [Eumeta japonica]|uniref:Uncharacterized protein n=1 Tax=Eumeta variegata TaxID=151549 RepID=A0A4C1WP24_EUMVA|nr:hypothetical protein EVAR_43316_1 [Eumeta japonica]
MRVWLVPGFEVGQVSRRRPLSSVSPPLRRIHYTRRRCRHNFADLRQRLDAHLPQHFFCGGDLGRSFSILVSILSTCRFSWLILFNLFSAASSSAALLAFSRPTPTTYLERDIEAKSEPALPMARLPIAGCHPVYRVDTHRRDSPDRPRSPPDRSLGLGPPTWTATGGQSPPSGSPA